MKRRMTATAAAAVLAVTVLAAPAPAVAAPVTDALDGAAIAAVTMAPNRLDLFTRGRDGALHWKYYANGAWSGWDDLGGQITSAPTAASWANGRMDVFARGATGTLVHRVWTADVGWARPWEDLKHPISSAPSAVSWGSGRLDVFARGLNNQLYQTYYQSGWSGWIAHGGSLTSAPAAASQKANSLNVFLRGTNNQLYIRSWSGSWSTFSSLGGSLASAPSAVSWADGRLDVFAKDGAGNLIQRYYNGRWSAAFVNLGGTLTSAPAVTSWAAGRLDIFSHNAAGALQQKNFRTTWGGQVRLGPLDPDELPIARDTRVVGVQAGAQGAARLGPIEYAYVNNGGLLVHGHQESPASTGSIQWTTMPGNEAYTGEPAMAVQSDGRVQALVHNTNGDILVRGQTDAASGTFASLDAGGWMVSPPSVAALPDGRLQMFATDADGTLFTKTQTGPNAAYGQWRSLGRAGLAGAPALGPTRTGLRLVAVDTSGNLRTAAIDSAGALSTWTTLGSGYTGRPAVVPYAGYRLRIFARTATGALVTALGDSAGAVPGPWQPVGDTVAAGPPAAVFSLSDARTYVFVRGADNLIHWTRETDIGSGQWEAWRSDNSTVSVTDPTIVEYDAGAGRTFGYLIKAADGQPLLYALNNPAAAGPFTARRLGGPAR